MLQLQQTFKIAQAPDKNCQFAFITSHHPTNHVTCEIMEAIIITIIITTQSIQSKCNQTKRPTQPQFLLFTALNTYLIGEQIRQQ